jgi:hypothetical protein
MGKRERHSLVAAESRPRVPQASSWLQSCTGAAAHQHLDATCTAFDVLVHAVQP